MLTSHWQVFIRAYDLTQTAEQHSQTTYTFTHVNLICFLSVSLCALDNKVEISYRPFRRTAIHVHCMISGYKPHTVTQCFDSGPKMGVCVINNILFTSHSTFLCHLLSEYNDSKNVMCKKLKIFEVEECRHLKVFKNIHFSPANITTISS